MKAFVGLLRGRRRRRKAGSTDSERLLRVYRETHRQVEDLRRAA